MLPLHATNTLVCLADRRLEFNTIFISHGPNHLILKFATQISQHHTRHTKIFDPFALKSTCHISCMLGDQNRPLRASREEATNVHDWIFLQEPNIHTHVVAKQWLFGHGCPRSPRHGPPLFTQIAFICLKSLKY